MSSRLSKSGAISRAETVSELSGAGKVAGTDLLPREAESGKGSLPIFSSTKFTRRNLKRDSKETTKGGQKTDV